MIEAAGKGPRSICAELQTLLYKTVRHSLSCYTGGGNTEAKPYPVILDT
jgi:hypothetical protein